MSTTDKVISMLANPTTIAEITTLTGIKETSARVLLSNIKRKLGHNVVSAKRDGLRYYSIAQAQAVAETTESSQPSCAPAQEVA